MTRTVWNLSSRTKCQRHNISFCTQRRASGTGGEHQVPGDTSGPMAVLPSTLKLSQNLNIFKFSKNSRTIVTHWIYTHLQYHILIKLFSTTKQKRKISCIPDRASKIIGSPQTPLSHLYELSGVRKATPLPIITQEGQSSTVYVSCWKESLAPTTITSLKKPLKLFKAFLLHLGFRRFCIYSALY